MDKEKLKANIEAILFCVGGAVAVNKIVQATGEEKKDVVNALKELSEEYGKNEKGIQIIELDGAYQMCAKPEFYDSLISIVNHQREYSLTDVMLETLSIIAYKQPITRLEIEKIRGVSSDHAVNRLLEFGLIQELGRIDAPGKPIVFGTTEEFLRCFGVKNTDELPSVTGQQLDEFKKQAHEEIFAETEVDI
ncbi:MAG: SMC-Scp complex subunit ScpB [Eubacterium sp.]|nr:SMC-Scp complex subunit ScpB [Eubacterium sp.]